MIGMTIHEGILDLITKLRGMTLDAQKFDEGNQAAGRRLTKKLWDIRDQVYDIRKATLQIRNARDEARKADKN